MEKGLVYILTNPCLDGWVKIGMTERDDTVAAKVVSDKNQIEYEGENYTVTGLARKLLIERHGWSENIHINGWMYFTKDGISLSELRDSIENIENDD